MTSCTMSLLSCIHQRFPRQFRPSIPFSLSLSVALVLLGLPSQARQKGALSDEDILNPNKLVFNRVLPFIDSFDGARVGTVFVTKRAILAHPTKGFFGEKCAGICPTGTDEIDASYVYVFQKKGECVIGVRGIGWGEKLERSVNGQQVEIGRVRHQSTAANIASVAINGVQIGPPTNQAQLGSPNGTNYKYYPRRQNSLGKTMGAVLNKTVSGLFSSFLGGGASQGASRDDVLETYSSTNEGFITDIHYFPAQELVKTVRQSDQLLIDLPSWLPSRHVISGNSLAELRKLVATCEAD